MYVERENIAANMFARRVNGKKEQIWGVSRWRKLILEYYIGNFPFRNSVCGVAHEKLWTKDEEVWKGDQLGNR